MLAAYCNTLILLAYVAYCWPNNVNSMYQGRKAIERTNFYGKKRMRTYIALYIKIKLNGCQVANSH